jgi:hypothetical protein
MQLLDRSEKLKVLSLDDKTSQLKQNVKFNSLDKNQQGLIDELRSTLRVVVEEAHANLKDELAEQRCLLENMQKQRLADDERKFIEEQRQLDDIADIAVLNHLSFVTMTDRREDIREVHRTTFSWIFKDPETVRTSGDIKEHTRPWTNFVHWLQEGEEIYWVNGKAGLESRP